MNARIPVRRLVPADAPAYRQLMLAAYAQTPDAFTSTVAERESLPLTWWESRMQDKPDSNETVFGGFSGGMLAGAAGLMRETREKTRHKATLFGMVVDPSFRRGGLGRALVDAVLQHAGTCTGLQLLQLTVTEGNAGAQRLYVECGFVVFGTEPMATTTATGFASKVHMWREIS